MRTKVSLPLELPASAREHNIRVLEARQKTPAQNVRGEARARQKRIRKMLINLKKNPEF